MCTARCQALLASRVSQPAMPPRRPARPSGGTDRPATRLRASVPQFTHVVDLTHVLRPDFPTYYGYPTFAMKQNARAEVDRFNGFEWTLDEHTGTHFDAPFHTSNQGATADAVLATELVVPLAVLDVREQAASDDDYAITPDDVATYEKLFGPLPDGCCVAYNSGWDAHVFGDKFRNADARGVMHHPGLHAETGALLMERDLAGIACDTLSFDLGNTVDFPVHMAWLPAGRWGLECVANLGNVPQAGATIVVGAPRVLGASGGPARVFALI